ncbi:MAG TPA: flagellar biosynthetic protein FliO [Xanthobacteraceae bacterium]
METFFGEGQSGFKVLLFLVIVLGLLALAFWLVRRFSGGRLGSAATRGRQPRLAVIDQAAVDGRRRLVLIRRDNVEHLLIIGGPTDVVVEQNILRAATTQREVPPLRPAPASDTLPRAVPLGDETMWPLQPEPTSKLEPAAKGEPAARLEPSLRTESAPRPPRAPATGDETAAGPAESETATPAPQPSIAPLPAAPASARERRPRVLDPLAGLAEELSRVPPPLETGGRRAPRLQPAPPTPPLAAPTPATAADSSAPPPADQNLSEMAQRLEAALRRPAKPGDKSGPTGAPMPGTSAAGEPPDEFAPPPRPARPDAGVRRPWRSDEARVGAVAAKAAGEPDETETDASPAAAARPEPKPQSLYDSLEQEMASLLNRPPAKP